jgi:RNA 3'-terminal phosphate cyclase (ATP)
LLNPVALLQNRQYERYRTTEVTAKTYASEHLNAEIINEDCSMAQTTELPVIAIDGGFGEGGGQIIRTSVSLAAITGRVIEIVNIRARRSKPGLKAQHLTSVLAAGALCDARMHGAELGSQYLRFAPAAPVQTAAFAFDVAQARGGASAGATGLVAQTLLVPLSFLPAMTKPDGRGVDAEILGGTHVPMSPVSDYIESVYLPLLNRMGLQADMVSRKAGFFPRGGGEIALRLTGGRLDTPLDLTERGRLQSLRAIVTTSQLPEHVALRAEDVLRKELKGFGVPVHVERRDLPSSGAGAAVVLIAECQNGRGGWTSLGERGKPMERVASDAIRGFRDWQAVDAGVDEHLADQLVLPCALVEGKSRWTTPFVTDHLRTVLFVTQQFLPIEYTLEEAANGTGLVTLRGVNNRR